MTGILPGCTPENSVATDEETARRVVELRQSGKSLREIGDVFGRTHSWAASVLKKEGIDTSKTSASPAVPVHNASPRIVTPRTPRSKHDKDTVRRVIELRQQHWTLTAIGDEVGLSDYAIRTIIQDARLEGAPRDDKEREEQRRCVELYVDGRKSIPEVAKETGIGYVAVRGYLADAGVLRDKGGEASPEPTGRELRIVYYPLDVLTRRWLEEHATREGLSLSGAVDAAVQSAMTAILYQPDDATRAWLGNFAKYNSVSLDEAIDQGIQFFRTHLGEYPS